MRFFKILSTTFNPDKQETLFGLDLQDKEGGLYVALRVPIDGANFFYEKNWRYDDVQLEKYEQILSKNLPNGAKTNFVKAIFERSR